MHGRAAAERSASYWPTRPCRLVGPALRLQLADRPAAVRSVGRCPTRSQIRKYLKSRAIPRIKYLIRIIKKKFATILVHWRFWKERNARIF
jgi:hypothetical protein